MPRRANQYTTEEYIAPTALDAPQETFEVDEVTDSLLDLSDEHSERTENIKNHEYAEHSEQAGALAVEDRFDRMASEASNALLEVIPPEALKIQTRLTELHVVALMARQEIAAHAENYTKLNDAFHATPISEKVVDLEKVKEKVQSVLQSLSSSEKKLGETVGTVVKALHELNAAEVQQRKVMHMLKKEIEDLEDELHTTRMEMVHARGLFAFLKKAGAEKKAQSTAGKISRTKDEFEKAAQLCHSVQNLKATTHLLAKQAVGAEIRKKTDEVEKKYSEMLGAIPELKAMKDRCADVYVLDKVKQYEPELAESIVAALPDFHRVDHETEPNYILESELGRVQPQSSEVKHAIGILQHHRPQNELLKKIVRFDFENQMAALKAETQDRAAHSASALEWEGNYRAALSSSDISLWHSIRKNPGFRQAFGNILEEYDSWNKKGAIEKAVVTAQSSDSNELFMLAYFPDKESLHVLASVLLGTGSSRRYAQKIFSQILKDPEWQPLLDEFLQKNPEFSDVLTDLKGSPSGEIQYIKNVSLRATTNYAVDTYAELVRRGQASKEPIDVNWLRLALEGFSDAKLIELAVEAGMLSAADQDVIDKAFEVINTEVQPDYVMGQVYVYTLRGHILKSIIEPTEQKEDMLKDIFVSLAKEIALCKGEKDKNKLSELLNNPILSARGIAANPELIKMVSENIDKYRILSKLMVSPYNIDTFFLKPEHSTVAWVDYLAESLERCSENSRYAADFLMEVAANRIDAESVERCEKKFGNNISSFHVAIKHLAQGLSASTIEQMPGKLPAVINTDEESSQKVLNYICEHHGNFLDSDASMQFCNRVVGQYGNQAESILKGYVECLDAEVISKKDAPLVTEFLEHFRIVSPAIISGYIEAKKTHQEEVYLAELNATAEGMISVKSVSESDRSKPYFKDLIRHVYPNNSGTYGSHASAEHCDDRSVDLKEFTIKPKYVIDLLSSGEITLKEGQTLSEEHMSLATNPILTVREKFESVGFDPQKMIELVGHELDAEFPKIDTALPLEEKIFRVMAESLYGSVPGQLDKVKHIILGYDFALHEDIREYIAGTGDRVSQASNKEYAELCELNSFYNDRIKDVTRLLTEKAFQSEGVRELMSEYFKSLTNEKANTSRRDKLNKLQVGKLGLSDGFLGQIKRTLEQRSGKKYTDAQAKKIIRLCENLVAKSVATESPSPKKWTKAVYGQLKSQRSKTMAAIAELTGKEIQPEELSLGDIDFGELLEAERSIETGTYNEDQFAAYTVEKAIGLFGKEQDAISVELSKFVSAIGGSRRVLNAVITKSKESAGARMTGGVCVAGDNPKNGNANNQWDRENYFQMVFQDPENLICQGLVLLHSEDHDGKKVLCASINPSSTYLYAVDEKSLYKGIMSQLEIFARDNGFADIALSSNKAIRTNRTGGQFEAAMDQSIAEKGKQFAFETSRVFSYRPAYSMSSMDVVWSGE